MCGVSPPAARRWTRRSAAASRPNGHSVLGHSPNSGRSCHCSSGARNNAVIDPLVITEKLVVVRVSEVYVTLRLPRPATSTAECLAVLRYLSDSHGSPNRAPDLGRVLSPFTSKVEAAALCSLA